MIKEKRKISANAICFIIAGIILSIFLGTKAIAATSTAGELKSSGRIVYDEGQIVIDSADFEALAREVDALKFKLGIE